MARPSNAHFKMIGLAALGFALAGVLFLLQHALDCTMLESLCRTGAYLMLAAAVLGLSYAFFLKSWQDDE